ncbi:MAG: cytidylate kinase-like family protein [Candidatus Eremiobacteraeota bacterium]|nr:cytidylate kinase-like family protein [Candidatus Eremiobacteraeota bacterium]
MIVTISNEYGSGAVAIAREAAAALAFEFVDQQLPVVVAKRLQTSPEEVEAAEDTRRSVGERMLARLELATPEMALVSSEDSFDECCLREVQTAVREYATHGNVVLVGRAASAILGRRGDVVRVFLHAPRDWRVHHVMTGTGVDQKTAAAEVDRIDAARRSYLYECYDLRWGETDQYDLALDTASFGHDASVAAIVAAVRARL